jgi:hypothetical protein
MGRLAQGFRWLLRRLADTRGVSLYETTAVVAMTAVVASVAIPMAMDRVENAKATKAAQEILTVSAAMQKFFEHTGRWPGETEIRRAGSIICFLQTGVPATDSSKGAVLPEITSLSLPTHPMDASTFLGRPCSTITADNAVNINDYVVRKPSETDYPNWQGPYMEPVAADPWDRAYIMNVLPLIFASKVDDPGLGQFSETAGKVGFGWVLTGGADRLLQTALTAAQLAPTSDDVGKNLGSRILKSTGGGTGSQ